ncbi:RNA polymerase sigma-70 factor (ECF subfamily) [Scopulibacillus daqui]|uniref:RNA polymerase sigma-70 factor (ECF subfamily) n=1 Tax=Scopulibacillus daqui TaxID=1469162 RepID=A0ABS2PV63_9BACL|nr:sigma-70 family RNA polymerase sigma factor [Scopulibacillus daqui]MBM7643910.1 RNA polymerase sigma-70 factor (ECF subfamily) [Scopulibacillus daqui]
MENNDPEKLLQRMSSGEAAAFDQFYEQYASFVYQTALTLTKDKSEAEDLCHDVFVEVFYRANSYDAERGSVKAWLAVKTKSRFLDRKRRANRIIYGGMQPERSTSTTALEDTIITKLDREMLKNAIKQLPKAQKYALDRKYFGCLTQKEIAVEMDKPLGTIKSLIRYGLNNLKKQLVAGKAKETLRDDHNHES